MVVLSRGMHLPRSWSGVRADPHQAYDHIISKLDPGSDELFVGLASMFLLYLSRGLASAAASTSQFIHLLSCESARVMLRRILASPMTGEWAPGPQRQIKPFPRVEWSSDDRRSLGPIWNIGETNPRSAAILYLPLGRLLEVVDTLECSSLRMTPPAACQLANLRWIEDEREMAPEGCGNFPSTSIATRFLTQAECPGPGQNACLYFDAALAVRPDWWPDSNE
jgi:hypothetical protein